MLERAARPWIPTLTAGAWYAEVHLGVARCMEVIAYSKRGERGPNQTSKKHSLLGSARHCLLLHPPRKRAFSSSSHDLMSGLCATGPFCCGRDVRASGAGGRGRWAPGRRASAEPRMELIAGRVARHAQSGCAIAVWRQGAARSRSWGDVCEAHLLISSAQIGAFPHGLKNIVTQIKANFTKKEERGTCGQPASRHCPAALSGQSLACPARWTAKGH